MAIFSAFREQISHWIGLLFQQSLTTSGTVVLVVIVKITHNIVVLMYRYTLQRSLQ